MWDFFKDREFRLWSHGGVLFLFAASIILVYIDVSINSWFGRFYDYIQDVLSGDVEGDLTAYLLLMLNFAWLASIWVLLSVFKDFFASHWMFRWRVSMTRKYHAMMQHETVRTIEGASQRIQEDTLKFARLVEAIGMNLLESVITLIAFTPMLVMLGNQIGRTFDLAAVAILAALGGTMLLLYVGRKLPGIEYDIQVAEAAYRKELVLGEDPSYHLDDKVLEHRFDFVRIKHFLSYRLYLEFNAVKYFYLQNMVLLPYLILAPSILSAAITLGLIKQISRAFGKIEASLQFLVRSWGLIVEFISVYKRLREFEKRIEEVR